MEQLVERLAAHRTIGHAPREELFWIATHGTVSRFQIGEIISPPSEVVDRLVILLTGRASISVTRGIRQRKVMEWQAGDVTGVLPYSRMTTAPGELVVEEPIEAVVLMRDDLPALIRNCPEVTAALVHVMTDRARRFTSTDLRDEKLVSLGKLAAVLAHEMNNPASAVMRDAKSMAGALRAVEEATRALAAAPLSEDQFDAIDRAYDFCLDGARGHALSGITLADREDMMTAWLETHGADTTSAQDLARTPITQEALDHLASALQETSLDKAVRWIAAGCAARSLAVNIERAAFRIHALVTAVKRFTHMDRDPDEAPVQVAAGLKDTISLLEGKARTKSVTLSLETPSLLPLVRGISAEINQIWMNLIDNAIDAAPAGGHVTVSAAAEGKDVVVGIVDDGPGIPADIQGSIFNPFFTTKSSGEGTGLGLDIVKRIVDWHGGEIDVASKPGRTEFRVSFPALHHEKS